MSFKKTTIKNNKIMSYFKTLNLLFDGCLILWKADGENLES